MAAKKGTKTSAKSGGKPTKRGPTSVNKKSDSKLGSSRPVRTPGTEKNYGNRFSS